VNNPTAFWTGSRIFIGVISLFSLFFAIHQVVGFSIYFWMPLVCFGFCFPLFFIIPRFPRLLKYSFCVFCFCVFCFFCVLPSVGLALNQDFFRGIFR
jgi:hypothetical protein